jgi:hypothetical protein
MVWYVLITVANAAYGVTVSQQDYFSKAACEAAAIVADEAARDLGHRLKTRCVPKG